MEAGRELDALVAEKVMGLSPVEKHGDVWFYMGEANTLPGTPYVFADGREGHAVKHYSTDIAAAWEVVEKMRAVDDMAWVDFRDEMLLLIDAPSAPHAICLAALRAVGVEE